MSYRSVTVLKQSCCLQDFSRLYEAAANKHSKPAPNDSIASQPATESVGLLPSEPRAISKEQKMTTLLRQGRMQTSRVNRQERMRALLMSRLQDEISLSRAVAAERAKYATLLKNRCSFECTCIWVLD